ncbi:unnamed protein product [Arctogadus glacialis]
MLGISPGYQWLSGTLERLLAEGLLAEGSQGPWSGSWLRGSWLRVPRDPGAAECLQAPGTSDGRRPE